MGRVSSSVEEGVGGFDLPCETGAAAAGGFCGVAVCDVGAGVGAAGC
jgi:hypothetical protein